MSGIRNRFKDAPWYTENEKRKTVLIGGAGGIGSWLGFLLMRANIQIMIFDDDLIEEHNIGGQLFKKANIGQAKVNALAEIIQDFTGDYIDGDVRKIDEKSFTNAIAISAFDNMAARKVMFEKWLKTYRGRKGALFMDGRLAAEQMQIFCIQADDLEACGRYEREYLFDDSQAEDGPCTFKQTSHAAAMIAAHMTGFCTNFLANQYDPGNGRSVPFYWEYMIPMDLLTVN